MAKATQCDTPLVVYLLQSKFQNLDLMKVLEQSLSERHPSCNLVVKIFPFLCCTMIISVIFLMAKFLILTTRKKNKIEIYFVPVVRIFIPKKIC
jgi:hypothetical protein